MLHAAVVAEVRGLLAAGLAQREVFRRMAGRISRGSIQRIDHGQYRDRAPRDEPDPPSGPGVACPTCGAKIVVFPCVACRARAADRVLGTDDLKELADMAGEPIGLDLKPGHQARYLEIHARKQRERAA